MQNNEVLQSGFGKREQLELPSETDERVCAEPSWNSRHDEDPAVCGYHMARMRHAYVLYHTS